MTVLRTLLLSLALVFSASSAAWPQDFSKGLEAARAGDYATALQEWRPLAEQGDAYAQCPSSEFFGMLKRFRNGGSGSDSI